MTFVTRIYYRSVRTFVREAVLTEYDNAFYKRLRKNDLGQTSHQGGPAIPKDLRQYFPPLPDPKVNPTEEFHLWLSFFDGAQPAGAAVGRWHFQTWGNKRRQETRLTQNIVPMLLKTAQPGDALVFERELGSVDRYRVTLRRQQRAEDAEILRGRGERWGPLGPSLPASLTGLQRELGELDALTNSAFEMFSKRNVAAPHGRLLRDAAFSRLVRRAYDYKCALCGVGFLIPVDDPQHEPPAEPVAAHIVPVAQNGSDDVRNGLCLCQTHHWVFDRGLIYVGSDDLWHVTEAAQKEPRNHDLIALDSTHLTLPRVPAYVPDSTAFEWHRQNVAHVS